MGYAFFWTIFFCSFLSIKCQVLPGAYDTEKYFGDIKFKNIALVVNHSSMLSQTHLVDTLITTKTGNIRAIFAPEHGFRGKADAGALIGDSIDKKTGIKIVSLYGKNKKPTPQQMQGLDYIVFDIQDVGVRFYTYISTLHYVMEACAENKVALIILDRPNPLAQHVSGPVLDLSLRSFVGMHPIPIVYGLTIGELAQMINGEGWLSDKAKCSLKIVKCKNYRHDLSYSLPVKPSPNLPNDLSVKLYPSLCLFEGTVMSVARGTAFPFQAVGYPQTNMGVFTFMPKSIEGMSKKPPHENQLCYGDDYRDSTNTKPFTLKYIIKFYQLFKGNEPFFNNFFNKLIGNTWVMPMILEGYPENEIEKKWQNELNEYKKSRLKYLLYE